jgi:hypothetical protein
MDIEKFKKQLETAKDQIGVMLDGLAEECIKIEKELRDLKSQKESPKKED